MRRKFGNELVVALIAALALLFAGLFALLLSSSTQNPPRPASPTDQPEAVNTLIAASPVASPSPEPLVTSERPAALEPTSTMPQVTSSAATADMAVSATPIQDFTATASSFDQARAATLSATAALRDTVAVTLQPTSPIALTADQLTDAPTTEATAGAVARVTTTPDAEISGATATMLHEEIVGPTSRAAAARATETDLPSAEAQATLELRTSATATIVGQATDAPASRVAATIAPPIVSMTALPAPESTARDIPSDTATAKAPLTPLSPTEQPVQASATDAEETAAAPEPSPEADSTEHSPAPTGLTTSAVSSATSPTMTTTQQLETRTATSADGEVSATDAVGMTATRAVDEPVTALPASPTPEREQATPRNTSTAIALSATLRATETAKDRLMPTSTPPASVTRATEIAADARDTAAAITATPDIKLTLTLTSTLSRPTPAQESETTDDVLYVDRREAAVRSIPRSSRWPGRQPATAERPLGDVTPSPEMDATGASTAILTAGLTATTDVDRASTATVDRSEARFTDVGVEATATSSVPAVAAEETAAVAEPSPEAASAEQLPGPTGLTTRAASPVTSPTMTTTRKQQTASAEATPIEKTATRLPTTEPPVQASATDAVGMTATRTVDEPEATLSVLPTTEHEQAALRNTSTAIALSATLRVTKTAKDRLIPTSTPPASLTRATEIAADVTEKTVAITATSASRVTATSTRAASDPTPVQEPELMNDVPYAAHRKVAIRSIAGASGWPGRLPATAERPPGDVTSSPQPDAAAIATATAPATTQQIPTATSTEGDPPAPERATLEATLKPTVPGSAALVTAIQQTTVFTPAAEIGVSPAPPRDTALGVTETVKPAATLSVSATDRSIATTAVALTAPAKTESALKSTVSGTVQREQSLSATIESTAVDPATSPPEASPRSRDLPSSTVTPEAETMLVPAVASAIQFAETEAGAPVTAASPTADATFETEIDTATPASTATADSAAGTDMTGTATQDAGQITKTASPATGPADVAIIATPVAARATPLPAVFAHLIATPTAFGAVDAGAAAACSVVAGWLPYEVQAGDSLLALALASGSSLVELRDGNCFGPVTGIIVGETIAVPQMPQSPIASPSSLFPISDSAYQVVGCDSPRAMITEPKPMSELHGIFAIRGSAQIPEGGKYRISVKPAWSSEYHRFLDVERSVSDEVIGLINTEIFGPGLQRLRLESLGGDGEIVEGSLCEIPLVFIAP